MEKNKQATEFSVDLMGKTGRFARESPDRPIVFAPRPVDADIFRAGAVIVGHDWGLAVAWAGVSSSRSRRPSSTPAQCRKRSLRG